ncbi:hypothetical protein M3231_04370 [Neobacillus mesonae]|nr:hypothetical protein [Neobacillus mesonae]
MTIIPVIIMIFVFVPSIVLIVSMPYLTRETISFGVTVSAVQFHSEHLRQMRKSYAKISATLHTILFIVCIISLIYGDEHSKQQSWIIVTYSLGMVVISLVINKLSLQNEKFTTYAAYCYGTTDHGSGHWFSEKKH